MEIAIETTVEAPEVTELRKRAVKRMNAEDLRVFQKDFNDYLKTLLNKGKTK